MVFLKRLRRLMLWPMLCWLIRGNWTSSIVYAGMWSRPIHTPQHLTIWCKTCNAYWKSSATAIAGRCWTSKVAFIMCLLLDTSAVSWNNYPLWVVSLLQDGCRFKELACLVLVHCQPHFTCNWSRCCGCICRRCNSRWCGAWLLDTVGAHAVRSVGNGHGGIHV